LLAALDDKKVQGPDKEWQNFQNALATAWDKDKVAGREKQLNRMRSQINEGLVIMMKYHHAALQYS